MEFYIFNGILYPHKLEHINTFYFLKTWQCHFGFHSAASHFSKM